MSDSAKKKGLEQTQVLGNLDKTQVLENLEKTQALDLSKNKDQGGKHLVVVEEQKSEIQKISEHGESFLDTIKQSHQKGQVNNFETINMFLEKGYMSEQEVVQVFAKEFGLEVINNLPEYKISKEVLESIPKNICLKNLLIPLVKIDNTLVVVFHDPSNKHVIDNISLITGCKIQPVVATKTEIKEFLNVIYDNQEEIDQLFYDMDIDYDVEDENIVNLDEENKKAGEKDSPIITFVNLIFFDAIRLESSDIHVENYERAFRIRYRVDGILKEVHNLPKDMAAAVTSRIKVMCGMDISEKRKPQDARLKVAISGAELSMRVNSVPTVNGEKIVLRILDDSILKVDMMQLGMETKQMNTFMEAISKPQGLVLLTGPTGSGKTATIYSGLMHLNTPDKNISTAEDPVEFRIHGINQVQMNSKIGLDFATALRAFLRQDPDIILVGEIRDIETAEISIKASSTGHMVLSTLHTNDTASTVNRLLGMGVPTYSIADNISLIVSQRLLRCLCPKCKVPVSEQALKQFFQEGYKELGISEEDLPNYEGIQMFQKSDGDCSNCNSLGYKGRVAVFEMLKITPAIKEAVFERMSPTQIKKIAIENGMVTLRQSALNKLKEGLTSADEVIRTTVFDY